MQLSQEIEDKVGQAYILSNLGLVACERGDLEAAEKLLTDGLALAQVQADKYAVSYFLSHLGRVSLQAGRLDQAIDRANETLTIRREIDLLLWTTADLTTLAVAHLASGDMDIALDYARQALAILDECGGEGPEFPQQDYFICYQVLAAAGQEEAAHVALQSAYDLVMARADKIRDPALRQSFLKRVPINREIVQECVKRNA
jgi:tetratricopeptide (TPR) repeat protein